MGLLSALSVIFFIVAFFSTKERIQPDPQQTTSLSRDLADLFKNRPWVVLFLATLFYFAAIVIRGNVMLPYFRFIPGNVDLYSWFNGFGLAALLAFVAFKMLAARWIDVPITLSLAIMGAILIVCAVVSWMAGHREEKAGNRE